MIFGNDDLYGPAQHSVRACHGCGVLGRTSERVAPVPGVLCLAFGAWYALGALGAVMYPL
jgi:hypothetical protein